MKKFLYFWYCLYVSTCNFNAKIRADGEPYEIAYWFLSLFMIVNLISILMLIKYFIGFDIKIEKFIFVVLFVAPTLILNYYIFLKKKKYLKLLKEINISPSLFISYFIFTLLFFIITGYINIL